MKEMTDTVTLLCNALSFRDTIELVVRRSLSGFQMTALSKMGAANGESPGPSARQSLSRSVAVSLPPVIALMLR
jgi:hypothetical protein